jgi:hypothetical protein
LDVSSRRRLGETAFARPRLSQAKPFDYVIPAWSAGIQIDMDVSGGILAHLMDAGMTKALHFHVL